MENGNNLRRIAEQQKNILAELETEIISIENNDLIIENGHLKAKLEKLEAEYLIIAEKAKQLSDQNSDLRNSLYEQVFSEKVKLVNSAKERLVIFFANNLNSEINRLTALEERVKSRISGMTESLRQSRSDINNNIYAKLDKLESEVNYISTEARRQLAETTGAFSQNEEAGFESLKNEQISGEQITAVTKKNNAERFLGLNLFNYAGILLIIIGTIATAQLPELPDFVRGLMMFALGAVMLAAGETLNRKRANIFSLGLTAGGVAVLYTATAISYFQLGILTAYPAAGLCALIAVGAFVLSTRYNSQAIAAFALIGGYLPMLSIADSIILAYGAMIYFVALNLLALIISFNRKWLVSTYIGLSLNILGTAYICLHFIHAEAAARIILILYMFFAFLNYTLIPIAGTYISKSGFKPHDVALLVLAYISPRIKILASISVTVISIIMYLVGILWLALLNSYAAPVDYFGGVPLSAVLTGTAVLVIVSLLSVFAVHDLVKFIVMKRRLGVEWYPLIVSGYFVAILTQNLITQYALSFASAWISIIYVTAALVWIIFGFVKRYSLIRKFGLGLALLSVVKLFIVDLASLTSGYRILSYFALGAVLIAISFVYQYFNRRLELKLEAVSNARSHL